MKRIKTAKSPFGDWDYFIRNFPIWHREMRNISYNVIRFEPEGLDSQMALNYLNHHPLIIINSLTPIK